MTVTPVIGLALLGAIFAVSACSHTQSRQTAGDASSKLGESVPFPDTRIPLALSSAAGDEHRAVMLQHLETIQHIVAALADEQFERAQGLTANNGERRLIVVVSRVRGRGRRMARLRAEHRATT